MKFFDAHCHLQDARIADRIDSIIESMRRERVANVICNGTNESDWSAVNGLAKAYGELIPAYGLHPWYVTVAGADWKDKLITCLHEDSRSVLGESGLDGNRGDFETQRDFLLEHLQIAADMNRSLSLHCVKAWGEMTAILKRIGDVQVIIHSFSGSDEILRQLLKYDVYFSFSGVMTRSRKIQQVIKEVPEDKLLVETDSPDLLPEKKMLLSAGRPTEFNQPSNLPLIVNCMSEVLSKPVEELAVVLEANFKKVI